MNSSHLSMYCNAPQQGTVCLYVRKLSRHLLPRWVWQHVGEGGSLLCLALWVLWLRTGNHPTLCTKPRICLNSSLLFGCSSLVIAATLAGLRACPCSASCSPSFSSASYHALVASLQNFLYLQKQGCHPCRQQGLCVHLALKYLWRRYNDKWQAFQTLYAKRGYISGQSCAIIICRNLLAVSKLENTTPSVYPSLRRQLSMVGGIYLSHVTLVTVCPPFPVLTDDWDRRSAQVRLGNMRWYTHTHPAQDKTPWDPGQRKTSSTQGFSKDTTKLKGVCSNL